MDESNLIQIYRDSVHALYRYVSFRCGGDRTLTEDVTQEAWLRAVKVWRKKGLPDNPVAWLKAVARNLLSNHFRRVPMVSLESLPPDWMGWLTEAGKQCRSDDHGALLSWGLARLKPSQARLVEAFHLDGKTVRDIAADLSLSERAVEGRLRRARLKLRKQLEPVVRSLEEKGGLHES
jgi:RNA polymerase sigma-70 factor (ECF subfamily)